MKHEFVARLRAGTEQIQAKVTGSDDPYDRQTDDEESCAPSRRRHMSLGQ
jgi:hypothetical protein